jgi:hypothetical protein
VWMVMPSMFVRLYFPLRLIPIDSFFI